MTKRRKHRPGMPQNAGAAAAPAAGSRAGAETPRAALSARSAAAIVVVLALLAAGIWWMQRAETVPPPGPASSAPQAKLSFVGTKECSTCHEAEHRAWQGSQHDRAMQQATEATVLGDFADAKFSYDGVTSTFFRRDGKFFARTDGPDGRLADFEIKYTYGVAPLQQYLVEFPDGRLQALSVTWDARPKEQGGQRWFRQYPGEKIDHRDELHWTRRNQNWNFMCADCHSTDVRKNYDAAKDRFGTTWFEINVGCEACHGPGSAHVAWAQKRGGDPTKGLAVVLDERRGASWTVSAETGNATRNRPRESEREIEVCAQCHARRAQIAEGYHAGRPFLDHYRPSLLESGLYELDGQQRDEVYVWGSFLQSRMYRAGVTCGDCHEPHSQKLRAPGNAMCGQCHLASKYDSPRHHRHREGEGSRCVDCHMPAKTYMVVDPRRDHRFGIPRPDLSAALGVPNACNGCHRDRDARWAAAQVAGWNPTPSEGLQRFAPALAAAQANAPGAAAALIALAQDPSQPDIARATAAAALERHPSPAAAEALRGVAGHSNPLIRHGAIRGAAGLPSEQRIAVAAPLLDDPLRAVRIEAAVALADVAASLPPERRASFDKAADEFERSQRYNADRPEARTTLGGFLAMRGRAGEAERELRAAIAMDPPYPPAYVNLADLMRSQGRDTDAERLLREGIAAAPGDPGLRYTLGLTLVRLKRTPEALAPLAEAARLAPDNARFAYVNAVALNSAGRPRDALAAIDRALVRHPDDRDLLFAGATFSRDAGSRQQAVGYATRLLQRDPQDREAAQLLAELRR